MEGLKKRLDRDRLYQRKRLLQKPSPVLASIEEIRPVSAALRGKNIQKEEQAPPVTPMTTLKGIMFPQMIVSPDSISKELETIIGADDVHQLRSILDTVTHCTAKTPRKSGLCSLTNPADFWVKRSVSGDTCGEENSGITTMGSLSFDLGLSSLCQQPYAKLPDSDQLRDRLWGGGPLSTHRLTARSSLCEATISSLSAASTDTIDTYAIFCSPELQRTKQQQQQQWRESLSVAGTPLALTECEQALSLLDFDHTSPSTDLMQPWEERSSGSKQLAGSGRRLVRAKRGYITPARAEEQEDQREAGQQLPDHNLLQQPRSSKRQRRAAAAAAAASLHCPDSDEEEEEEIEEECSESEESDSPRLKKKPRRGGSKRLSRGSTSRTTTTTTTRRAAGRGVCAGGQPRRMAPPQARSAFLDWIAAHRDNPYPTAEDKEALAGQTGLSVQQVIHWFSNMRKRRLAPLSSGKQARASVDIRFQDELEKRQKSLTAAAPAVMTAATSTAGSSGHHHRVYSKLQHLLSKLPQATGLKEIPLAPVVGKLSVSRTIEIHSLIKDMEKEGTKVLSLALGEPDFLPPSEVIEATVSAARNGHTKYTAVTGELSLREAIAEDLRTRKGIQCNADQIVALLAVVRPGSKVIIPAPYWTSYPDMVRLCGGEPVILPTREEDNYNLRPEALRALLEQLTSSSKDKDAVSCLVLCNPCNPSGAVPSRDELLSLSSVLQDFPSVLVLADEIYERLLYEGVTHTSLASLDTMRHRTVTVVGPSKAFSMTGFRVGASVSPPHIARAIGKLQSQITSCASSLAQQAALAALREVPPAWVAGQVQRLQRKRDLALDLLAGIPGVSCCSPRGAFYLFPRVSHYFGKKLHSSDSSGSSCGSGVVTIDNSFTLCRELLRRYHVALVPGEAFGCDECVRLCFAAEEETLREAVKRLKHFLLSLRD